ncbi:hypothetical protein ACEWY4_000257 [Coilia grayii]|uniref:Uncharacterized protein n=1 Tax=Coilia grayii TaxID=363190 RepID=A0ABD1KW45_9TELE
MAEKHPVSKLKRRKTSVEDCKSEHLQRSLPKESIGSSLVKQEQPKCNRASDRAQSVREWWAQPGLSPLERVWALTLQAFSPQVLGASNPELLSDLPPPQAQLKSNAREKQAEWRWCCLGDEVGALPEMPPVAESVCVPTSSASPGQPVPVLPANAAPPPPPPASCPSDRGAPPRLHVWASARAPTGSPPARQEEEEEEGRKRHCGVSVPTKASPSGHRGTGDEGRTAVGMATSGPATSSIASLAPATDTRPRGRPEPAAGTAGSAATPTAAVTLAPLFSTGRGAQGGRGGRAKEEEVKRRPRPPKEHCPGTRAPTTPSHSGTRAPTTPSHSGTRAPPTPSAGAGAGAGAGTGTGAQAQGASVSAQPRKAAGIVLECCPMCLLPFPAG